MDPLVSVADFQTYMQADLDAAAATIALRGASGVVRHFCRWVISSEDTTFTLDGNGATVLSLPTLQLNEVDEVRIDDEVLDTADYTWSHSGQLEYASTWPKRFRCIEVDASHGYDPIPDEAHIVVCALAARYYVNPEGLRSKAVGGISHSFVLETMRGDLAQIEQVLIAGYRLP